MQISHEDVAKLWEEINKLRVEQAVLREALRAEHAVQREALQMLKESNKFLTEEVHKLRMSEAILKTSVRIYIGVAGVAWGILGTMIGTVLKAIFH